MLVGGCRRGQAGESRDRSLRRLGVRRGEFSAMFQDELRWLSLQFCKPSRKTGQDIGRGLGRRRRLWRLRPVPFSVVVALVLRVGEAGVVDSLTSLLMVACIVHCRQLGWPAAPNE